MVLLNIVRSIHAKCFDIVKQTFALLFSLLFLVLKCLSSFEVLLFLAFLLLILYLHFLFEFGHFTLDLHFLIALVLDLYISAHIFVDLTASIEGRVELCLVLL